MSDLMSAISYDIEEYERRCRRFKQKIQYMKTSQGCDVPNCYGKHAERLRNREKRENLELKGNKK